MAEVIIAVNKDKDTVFFFPVVAWGNLARALAEYTDKGDKITVSGYLAYKSWKNEEEEKRCRTYINANSVEFMTKSENGKAKNKPAKRDKSQRDEADDEAFYYDP